MTPEEKKRRENAIVWIFLIVGFGGLIVSVGGLETEVARAAIWIGSLALLVVIVIAVVGATSASWTAGRRIAAPTRAGSSPPPFETGATVSPPPHPEIATHDNVVQALRDLGKLHSEGVLSDDEFAQAKGSILARSGTGAR